MRIRKMAKFGYLKSIRKIFQARVEPHTFYNGKKRCSSTVNLTMKSEKLSN